jgi:Tn3 transposase DDE domain
VPLRAANRILVDYHHQLPLAAAWGDGSFSSSGAQRIAIERNSVLGSFYQRYFGFYERAVGIYTHVSNQHVFASRVISCAPREALYVLDGRSASRRSSRRSKRPLDRQSRWPSSREFRRCIAPDRWSAVATTLTARPRQTRCRRSPAVTAKFFYSWRAGTRALWDSSDTCRSSIALGACASQHTVFSCFALAILGRDSNCKRCTVRQFLS